MTQATASEPIPHGLRGIRRTLRRAIEARARPVDVHELRRSAVVFAPHPDDETLGCGGTILRKRAEGAEVTLVFLTDGRQSHDDHVVIDALIRKRGQEGLAAASALGIDEANVVFFEYVDGSLGEHVSEASARAAALLRELEPQEVYVSSRLDVMPDHIAAHDIVCAAVRQACPDAPLLEYLVWFWHYWPWARRRDLYDTRIAAMMRTTARSLMALRREELVRVPIRELHAAKWEALNHHATQMRSLKKDCDWPTLGDVWDGRFLDCQFGDCELFIQRKLSAADGDG